MMTQTSNKKPTKDRTSATHAPHIRQKKKPVTKTKTKWAVYQTFKTVLTPRTIRLHNRNQTRTEEKTQQRKESIPKLLFKPGTNSSNEQKRAHRGIRKTRKHDHSSQTLVNSNPRRQNGTNTNANTNQRLDPETISGTRRRPWRETTNIIHQLSYKKSHESQRFPRRLKNKSQYTGYKCTPKLTNNRATKCFFLTIRNIQRCKLPDEPKSMWKCCPSTQNHPILLPRSYADGTNFETTRSFTSL